MEYLNIDIQIDIQPSSDESRKSEPAYLVAAVTKRGKRKIETIRQSAFTLLPNLMEDLEPHLMQIGARDVQDTLRRESISKVQEVGTQLFDSLIGDKVRALYDERKKYAWENGYGLRLSLKILPLELIGLPWEFLFDARPREYLCLSQKPKIVLVRSIEEPSSIKPLSYTPPLRLYGMNSAPRNLPLLLAGPLEETVIDDALAKLKKDNQVELTWHGGKARTLQDLKQQALQSNITWHVFHFIGHGCFNGKEGQLAFEDPYQNTEFINAREFSLSLPPDIRLVFLNGCETARGDLSSIPYSLAKIGIPAVLGMQFKIADPAAALFAESFYTWLAAGASVDEAVAEARFRLSTAKDRTLPLDWATPILYMSSSNNLLFTAVRKEIEPEPPEKPKPPKPPEPPEKPEKPKPRYLSWIRPRRLYLVAAVLGVLLLLTTLWFVLPPPPPPPTTFCIGTDFPTTGTDATRGAPLRNGADLAIKLNPDLGSGYMLNACDKNDVSSTTGIHDPVVGAKNVRNLLADRTVLGLVGPGNSNVAQTEIPIAAQAGLPIVGPYTSVLCLTLQSYCTYPGQDQVHPAGASSFFRTCSNSLQQGQAANLLFKSLGLQTVFVVDDSEIYGQELANIFLQYLKDGGTVLGHDHILKDESPARLVQLAKQIVSDKPDAVFYGGVSSNGAGYLKKQLDQAGFTGPLLGGAGIADDQQFLNDAGPAANNTYAIDLGPDPSTLPQSFIQAYYGYYGSNPSQISAQSYDAAMILITAIKSLIKDNRQIMHSDVGTIRTKVLEKVRSPNQPYHGLTGPITFDSNGDNAVAKIFIVYAVEKGQWIYKPNYTVTLN